MKPAILLSILALAVGCVLGAMVARPRALTATIPETPAEGALEAAPKPDPREPALTHVGTSEPKQPLPPPPGTPLADLVRRREIAEAALDGREMVRLMREFVEAGPAGWAEAVRILELLREEDPETFQNRFGMEGSEAENALTGRTEFLLWLVRRPGAEGDALRVVGIRGLSGDGDVDVESLAIEAVSLSMNPEMGRSAFRALWRYGPKHAAALVALGESKFPDARLVEDILVRLRTMPPDAVKEFVERASRHEDPKTAAEARVTSCFLAPPATGVLVREIVSREAAFPLVPGDVLLEWNGAPVVSWEKWTDRTLMAKKGEHTAVVMRGGQRVAVVFKGKATDFRGSWLDKK